MRRGVLLASAASLLAFLAGAFVLARLEGGGPAHAEIWLDGGVPATVYLPGDLGDPPPVGERPPAVVAMHGFASDRALMSSLCRKLAASGYAVLAFDAAGHGGNRNPYRRARAVPGSFEREFAAAVEFLRIWPYVDGERIAVLGHSMGASAALDYASRDSGIDAAVLVSGGGRTGGPYRPANTLFLYAAGDPSRLVARVRARVAVLAGVDELALGKTSGDPRRRDAVRIVEIPGADHQSVVWADATLAETLAWLDASFGLEGGRAAGSASDPRLAAAVWVLLAFVGALPGLGLVVAAIVPRGAPTAAEGRMRGLLALVLACAAVAPVMAVTEPAPLVSAEVADRVVPHLGLAGLALLALLWLRRPGLLRAGCARPLPALVGAGLALVVFHVGLAVPGVVFHAIGLTPERALVFLLCLLGFVPFQLAFNLLLRRGPWPGASGFAVLGRLLVLGVLAAAVPLAGLDRVILLMLPALAGVSLVFEVFASALYAASRSVLSIALADAGLLALVCAAVMPIRL